jgi:hypothetical protein
VHPLREIEHLTLAMLSAFVWWMHWIAVFLCVVVTLIAVIVWWGDGDDR